MFNITMSNFIILGIKSFQELVSFEDTHEQTQTEPKIWQLDYPTPVFKMTLWDSGHHRRHWEQSLTRRTEKSGWGAAK